MIKINIDNKEYEFNDEISLDDIINKIDIQHKDRIVAAIINNKVYELNATIDSCCNVSFLTRRDVLGNRIYRRSLFLLMAKAVYNLFPNSYLSIEHSLSNGIYCELYKDSPLNQVELNKIKVEMNKIVNSNLPIKRHQVPLKKAIDIFEKQGFTDKVKFLEQLGEEKYTLYELDGYYDYFYYHMVPTTGYLNQFDFHFRFPGFVLLFPQKNTPDKVANFKNQPKLANIFMEYEKLGQILEVGTVNELNTLIKADEYEEIVRIAEALHEKNIARISDKINNHINNKRIILIAGPSSSGKTTFTHRLSTQLKINGLRPVAISTDDYFVNRENTPIDEDGNFDFEALEAINLDLFNKHLIDLLQGKKVEIPVFNFQKGKREYIGRYLKIIEDQPILIEGIHGLNERLTSVIPQDHKFKIYVSALTQINIDRHNRIPTTDTRLIRRIIRDHKYRGHSADVTIDLWPSVRKGEEKNIFPYQENADIMFNSALIYEMAVLKKHALPLLQKIDRGQPSYYEAKRLIELLNCFKIMPEKEIPRTSILREFVGGSTFR